MNSYLANDRGTDLKHAGTMDMQVAEQLCPFGEKDFIPDSYDNLIDYLSKDLKNEIKLNSPVTKI